MEQTTRSNTDDFFGPVERADYDIDTTLDDPDITIGRSGTGIVTIGLFGGKRTTDNPATIEAASEQGGRGISFIKRLAHAAQDIEDFPGDIRVPREIEDAIASGATRTDPFGAFKTVMYLGNMDNRLHHPLMDGLVEYFETEYDGRYDIRAIEFDFDNTDPKEKYRAIYPWAKREHELSIKDDIEGYEAPKPIQELSCELRGTPIECRDYRRLEITVHYYNHRSDRDGKYDRDFQMDDFHGADHQFHINKDRRDTVEQTLDKSQTNTHSPTITYNLTLTVPHDDLTTLLESDDHHRITTNADAARHLAQKHHDRTYPDTTHATVGIVNTEENDDTITFDLTIRAD